MFLPSFHRFRREAAIIGRLVIGFGELEYKLAICATKAIAGRNWSKDDSVLRAVFRLRATSGRIDVADALMRPFCRAADLERECKEMLLALRYCLRIRNQFAHANWADDHKQGLFFCDLEKSANSDLDFVHFWHHVDLSLLEEHEAYFSYTQAWLYFLEHELEVRAGFLPSHDFPKPQAVKQPRLHNPPEQHVPPWLVSSLKARYLRHAREQPKGDRSRSSVSKAGKRKLSSRQRREMMMRKRKSSTG